MFLHCVVNKRPVSSTISTPRCGDQEINGRPDTEAVLMRAGSVHLISFWDERPASQLASQHLIWQQHESQPPPAPHTLEREGASPQHLLPQFIQFPLELDI